MKPGADDELAQVAQRYARRRQAARDDRYSPTRPDVQHLLKERRQALLALLAQAGMQPLQALRLVEVGCGNGVNLLELLQLGFAAEHLQGIELLPERHAQARQQLPAAVRLMQGDASTAPVADTSVDLVMQCTVFSSLLDDGFQQQLAQAMWRWLKPGGAVIWYDFTVNNPRNPDVRGVPLKRLRALFPLALVRHRRVTLAPPLARALCRVHPGLIPVFHALPLLRTHVLAWVGKPLV